MRFRLTSLSLAIFLGLVVPGVRQAHAQGKNTVPKIDERLFLLYVLEDMSRRDVTDTNKLLPGRRKESATVMSARFLAQQRLLFDIMRRYVQKKKYDEILTRFEAYEKELNLLEEYLKVVQKSWAEFDKKRAAAAQAASSRVLMTGLGYALTSMAAGNDDARSFARGMAALYQASLIEQQKLRTVNAAVGNELLDSLKKAEEEFKPKAEKAHKEFWTQFQEFISESKFEDAEFAFQLAQTKEEPTRNPFLLVAKARMTLDNKEANVKEMMEQAGVCHRAALMVPADRILDIHRAVFIGTAGMIANRAAAKDIGVTGFPLLPKGATEAAKLAYKIWTAYSRLEPFDTNYTDDVVQAFILAAARVGDAKAGYLVILKTSTTPDIYRRIHPRPASSPRPDYWYDCARVCSTAGNAQLALECLQHALRVGFNAKEEAKISPDLRFVRENRATRDQFERLFP
jgi:hypothetical protein